MKRSVSRREFIQKGMLATGASLSLPLLSSSCLGPRAAAPDLVAAPSGRRIAAGPFQPTWESLTQGYKCPEWFRDAKFGIWAHWSAQCVPEQGDWYARQMYTQGHPQNKYHVEHYGHPSKFGFMEIDHLWKAERWDPEQLIALYKKAGAKYFFALANHHDNFDNFNSRHHAWNSVNVGPKKDLIGIWAKTARAAGLRFGVSNHSAHAWHWFQTAYGYDPEGPQAGVRYDAFRLTKADGKGQWWDGLDPQDLYTGRNILMPDGLTSIKAANDWHAANDRVWNENQPPKNPAFVEKWFLRCQDLMDQYQPDVVYFDNTELPLGQAGLDVAAHFYNANLRRNGGRLDCIITGKKMAEAHRPAVVEDIERGVATGIRPEPWQTDTCIGSWHYQRSLFEQHKYKTAQQVVQMLVDIVSKNGNLMLSVPVRGDGTIDSDEVACVEEIGRWMAVNGEGIFSTRPWKVYGEGPSVSGPVAAGQFGGARDVRPYTARDVRFTAKGDAVYAFLMGWPENREAVLASLASHSPQAAGLKVTEVSLLGHDGRIEWTQGAQGLAVKLPERAPSDHACVLKIRGVSAA
ncbi:MAG TPA: alpha-L-fucosidase [Opitutaceae bacterium]|nr:alpha-L-fucosidase [Opitutaceae bacterium]